MNTPVQVSLVWFLQIEQRNGYFSVQRGAPQPKKKCAHRAHQKSTNDLAWNLELWHSSLQLFFFLPKTPSLQRRVVESTCQSAWQSMKGYLSLFFGLDGRVSSKTISWHGRPLFIGNAVLFKKICGWCLCIPSAVRDQSEVAFASKLGEHGNKTCVACIQGF